jgi:hypothetical protein
MDHNLESKFKTTASLTPALRSRTRASSAPPVLGTILNKFDGLVYELSDGQVQSGILTPTMNTEISHVRSLQFMPFQLT